MRKSKWYLRWKINCKFIKNECSKEISTSSENRYNNLRIPVYGGRIVWLNRNWIRWKFETKTDHYVWTFLPECRSVCAIHHNRMKINDDKKKFQQFTKPVKNKCGISETNNLSSWLLTHGNRNWKTWNFKEGLTLFKAPHC